MMEQARKEYLDKNKSEKMCSSKIGEAGEMCSPADADTCGDGMLSTSGEFVEVLCFRHFARYMSFAPTGKQGRKKQIMDGIEVSVVLHLV